ncbi:hypothetical protein Tco_1555621 [Tanacetum coccineum]
MTIAEYVEYEEKMKRQNNRNPRSHFLTKYDDTNDYMFCPNTSKEFPNYSCDAKIDTYYNLPPLLLCFKPIQPYTEHRYESLNVEFIEEISYMLDGESVISEQEMSDNTSEPDLEPQDKGMSSDDDVDEWQIKTSEDDEVHEVSSMANNDTVGEDGSLSEPLPCQLPPRELRLGSFTLPYTIVKIRHSNMANFDREIVFNEWMLDSFNIEAEYAKEFGDLYSRRFDEYKRHDVGFEEDELWQSGDEKTDYEPPFMDIETFEVKKYSFKGGRSFICITKQLDDTLPLGRENGTRFKEMIRNELGGGENNQKET